MIAFIHIILHAQTGISRNRRKRFMDLVLNMEQRQTTAGGVFLVTQLAFKFN